MSVLDAVSVHAPVAVVVRTGKVGAIARRQHTAGPDIELRIKLEASDSVQDVDGVGGAVELGVEHQLDVFRNRSVHVEPDAIDGKPLSGAAHRRVGVGKTATKSSAKRYWTEWDLPWGRRRCH